jgi:hypothetical protein
LLFSRYSTCTYTAIPCCWHTPGTVSALHAAVSVPVAVSNCRQGRWLARQLLVTVVT